MIKITEELGFWKREATKRMLFYEACPNPNCPSGELHYPICQETAQCPACRSSLMGPDVTKGPANRVIHHLEKK